MILLVKGEHLGRESVKLKKSPDIKIALLLFGVTREVISLRVKKLDLPGNPTNEKLSSKPVFCTIRSVWKVNTA